MGKVLMYIEGLDGQVELLTDRVIVHRKGAWNMMKYGINSRREIPIGAISEVSFREPSLITFGEIDFVRSGRSADEKKRGSNSAVRFSKKKFAEFEKLKEKVFEMVEQYASKRQTM
jgi:hypothetical protein